MAPLSRRQLQTALICFTAFLLYATLWPFDFNFSRGLAGPRKISWIPFFDPVKGPGRRDAVLNLLVFLPFGILSFMANSASAKIRRPVLIATLLGSVMSLFIELAQIGLPSRNPSTSDLLMNTTGALLGALSARALQRNVRSDPEGFRLRIRRNAVSIALIAYALALLASTMRTFDPFLNWSALGIRARAFVESPFFPDHMDLDYTAWMVLSFGFLSFLAAEGFSGASRDRRRPFRYSGAFIACSVYVIFLEASQILFRSRDPLLGHALLGILGTAYGIACHAATDRFHDSGKLRNPLAISLLLFHYTLLLLLAFLSPIPHSIGGFRFDLHGFIPIFFYLRDISLLSLYAALKTIVLYIPMGIMLNWTPDATRHGNWPIPVLFSAGLQATIEICRGFSGQHYPDPTNVFLAALGAYAGAVLIKSILAQE